MKQQLGREMRFGIFLAATLLVGWPSPVSAAQRTAIPGVKLEIGTGAPPDVAVTVQLLLLLTVLSLAPAILILMTAFTRIVVVLSFVRMGLGTQQTPPNQVLIGLALFITFYVMAPTFSQVYHQAVVPYLDGKLSQQAALEAAAKPLKAFMAKHTREKDLRLFLRHAKGAEPKSIDEIPLHMLVPAFVLSELRTAFQIGFLLLLPFLVIDMIVASTLMAMGMVMLPPVMISLPFKLLLFVLVDGWYLVVESLLAGY